MQHTEFHFVLRKDLPGCSAGRIFKYTQDMQYIFHSMTDQECADGNLSVYKIPVSRITPEYFQKVDGDGRRICVIKNAPGSWILNVDNQTIHFQGSHNADYFIDHYAELGYKIIIEDESTKLHGED